jgi:hypothetical protein
MLGAGLAEMDLAVDDTREHVEALAIHHFAGARGIDRADLGYPASDDADIALGGAVLVDDRAAAKDQIEIQGHERFPRRTLPGRPTPLT